jgi:4-amino-4-deoxy-L-arabinose transferase-like glycosyltransferase
LSIVLARRNRLDTALIYGIAGGFALLAKSSCQLFIGLSAFAPVLFFEKNLKKFVPKAINYFFLLGIGVIIAFAMYNIQRLSPFLHFVAEKNYTFISTPKELLHNPFQNVIPNIYNIPLYILWESGVIVILVGVAGLLALLRKDRKLGLYFLIWVVIPYIVVMFINKVLFPRYIIFLPTLFVILAAYFLDSFKKLQKVLIALIAVSVVYYHYTIIFNPWNIPFPDVDRGQYLEDWPAGWGIKEIMTYSREHSSDKPVILLGEGNFGMAGDVLNSSLKRSDKITVKGYWPLGLKELQDNQKELDTNHVYVVFTHRSEFPADWPIKLIKKYDKPGHKNSNIYLYELTK